MQLKQESPETRPHYMISIYCVLDQFMEGKENWRLKVGGAETK